MIGKLLAYYIALKFERHCRCTGSIGLDEDFSCNWPRRIRPVRIRIEGSNQLRLLAWLQHLLNRSRATMHSEPRREIAPTAFHDRLGTHATRLSGDQYDRLFSAIVKSKNSIDFAITHFDLTQIKIIDIDIDEAEALTILQFTDLARLGATATANKKKKKRKDDKEFFEVRHVVKN